MFDQLINMEQWRTLKRRSANKPMLIMKHSNTSPDSSQALQEVRNGQQAGLIKEPINLIVVQENREISNTVAKDLKIKHASPQVIIIREEKVIYSANKDKINAKAIAKALK